MSKIDKFHYPAQMYYPDAGRNAEIAETILESARQGKTIFYPHATPECICDGIPATISFPVPLTKQAKRKMRIYDIQRRGRFLHRQRRTFLRFTSIGPITTTWSVG